MNEINKAWRTLGLDPDSSREAIDRRYKRLALVWHPDRFPSDQGKLDAEEEMKKINQARDILLAHFYSGHHQASDCECQHSDPEPAGTPTDTDEALAKRRDEERRRSAERAQTSDEHFSESSQQPSKPSLANNISLRWKVAAAELLLFLGVSTVGYVGWEIKQKIRSENYMKHVEQEAKNHPPSPPVYKMPAAIGAEEIARREFEKKRRETDIFNLTNEIDRHKQQISKEDSMIAKYQDNLNNQTVSDSEHQKARGMINYLQKHRQEDITGLQSAQEELNKLNGTTSQPTTTQIPVRTQKLMPSTSKLDSSNSSSILDQLPNEDMINQMPSSFHHHVIVRPSAPAETSTTTTAP